MWSALRAETTSPIHSDATPPWLVVSLLRAYHITPRPSATLRREAHYATLQHPDCCLPHSIPQPPQPVRFACSRGLIRSAWYSQSPIKPFSSAPPTARGTATAALSYSGTTRR